MKKFILIFQLVLCISFSIFSQTFRYFDKGNSPVDSSTCYYFTHGIIHSEGFDTLRSFYCESKYLKSLEPFYRGRHEGISYYYYLNRKLKEKVAFREGNRIGTASLFHENGRPKEIRVYYPKEENIKRPSSYRIKEAWDSTGASTVKDYNGYLLDKMEVGKIKDGLRDSVWIIYNEKGEKIATEKYNDGKFIEGERTNGIHYKEREISASPKESLESLYYEIGRTMNYPLSAKRSGVEGKVLVQFVVEKDGSISNVKVFKGFDKACDQEAVRVVKRLKPWNPGVQRGLPVRQMYTLPISFKLH